MKKWSEEPGELDAVRVPGCLKKETGVREITVHNFRDKSEKANAKALYVCHECQDGTVSTRLVAARSRYVGAIKVHEYCALRTYGSTGWSQSNIKDLRSIGDSQKQSPILGRQGKSWFFGARTESKFQNILSVIEMEKFILSPV